MSNWNVYKLVGHAIPIMWSIEAPVYTEVAKALVVAWDVHQNLYTSSSEALLSGLEGQGGGLGIQTGGRDVDEEGSSASYFQDTDERVHKKKRMMKKRKWKWMRK